jgi:hypothetical protein
VLIGRRSHLGRAPASAEPHAQVGMRGVRLRLDFVVHNPRLRRIKELMMVIDTLDDILRPTTEVVACIRGTIR